MAAWGASLLLSVLLRARPLGGALTDGRDRGLERDVLATADRDGWDRDRDRDFLYGGFGYRDYYSTQGGSYRDYYGGGYQDFYTGRDFAPERRDALTQDDCHRVEANGVPLADALREAATLLGNASHRQLAPELEKLLSFFTGVEHRRFLLAHCPQAVVLASLRQLEFGALAASTSTEEATALLRKMLEAAPGLRAPHRPSPQWAGEPWEPLLSDAQRRTGVVLLPTGEQQFHVEHVAAAAWAIHPRRRCAGRRDLGNLQATPLAACLAKCAAHPLCRSATFWHWQPGGFGFEQRCFLSSTCTEAHATAEGAENAVLFEKRGGRSPREEALLRRTIVAPGGAPWAPRCGHRMATTRAGDQVRLWVLGGVGVDPFANTSAQQDPEEDDGMGADLLWGLEGARGAAGRGAAGLGGSSRVGSRGLGSALDRQTRAGSTEASPLGRRDVPGKKEPNATGSSVVEAYLSRHVELNGELPPLRSLPYGRLADVWRSDDLGSTWHMVTSEAPWGPRAFFGALPVWGGRALLLVGGVHEPGRNTTEEDRDAVSAALPREYMNDAWWAQVTGAGLEWHQLAAQAPWIPRAAFQLVALQGPGLDDGSRLEDRVLVLGGRSADGTMLNDVWQGLLPAEGRPAIRWEQVAQATPWAPRADFAATASAAGDVWILGGCDAAGRALSDVWWSSDGSSWRQLVEAAPWGPRIGAAAVSLGGMGGGPAPLVLFGGYAYEDTEFGPTRAVASESAHPWSSASWVSQDGLEWQPLNVTRMSWTPNAMHAALVAAPCGANQSQACAYAAGGLTHEGYYDNSVHRLLVSSAVRSALQTARAATTPPQTAAASSPAVPDSAAQPLVVGFALVALGMLALLVRRLRSPCSAAPKNGLDGGAHGAAPPLDPRVRRMLCGAFLTLLVVVLALAYLLVALARLSRELRELRSEAPRCRVDGESAGRLLEALGLPELPEQWDQFGTLLRLALREPQFSYGSLGGGFNDYWRGSGRAGDGFGYGGRGYDRGYGLDGGYGRGHAAGDGGLAQDTEAGAKSAAARRRELSLLPTTQGLSCRSPRCDRNASTCAGGVARSLASPYGCCSDYMLIMLRDVTDWLQQQGIPYFVTYGTLLGALRDGEILPYTQDMDIVVDRSFWPQLQRGLEAAEFFGGRRYLFGVDQWEERVSRVCADWEGFAASVIGGPDGDHLSRGTEFHLDVYASDWWQIKDLHLVDCVEPLGSRQLQIRGRNFSAPARPRACVEKLYGADWRTPKHALSGVN